jgi:hypothetical protein
MLELLTSTISLSTLLSLIQFAGHASFDDKLDTILISAHNSFWFQKASKVTFLGLL